MKTTKLILDMEDLLKAASETMEVCIVDAGTCDLTVTVFDLSESVLERNAEELTVTVVNNGVVK